MINIDTTSDLEKALRCFRDDAYDIVTEFARALAKTDEWMAVGFPSSTPGANTDTATVTTPASDEDELPVEEEGPDGYVWRGPVNWTPVERHAHRDTWLRERTLLLAELVTACDAVERCAMRVRGHAFVTRVRPQDVEERLRPECWTHARAGFAAVDVDPRGSTVEGKPVCRRCSDFWKAYDIPMPPALVERFEANHQLKPAEVAKWKREQQAPSTAATKRARKRGQAVARVRQAILEIERGTTTESAADMAARFTEQHGGAA